MNHFEADHFVYGPFLKMDTSEMGKLENDICSFKMSHIDQFKKAALQKWVSSNNGHFNNG